MEKYMDLKFILKKTKSPTYAELLADRGHPGPNVFQIYY
ncbi:hypothetical protein SAMN04489723_10936 [Algoriphagus aquimarinus]|uniref:Uncharacterized protein n=1 Tax=Algoriphagus aquimarinus TaxID=237018 RepID=A0A1I1AQ68_9BACT|nr:hypothetical protein SAMN04489723_10936 [Algoriphagus aquimarinus]